jgi:hypothetical protein
VEGGINKENETERWRQGEKSGCREDSPPSGIGKRRRKGIAVEIAGVL